MYADGAVERVAWMTDAEMRRAMIPPRFEAFCFILTQDANRCIG